MLNDFIRQHREEILSRTRTKVAFRTAPRPTEAELEHGVPLFLDQLIDALASTIERGSDTNPELGRTAANHGADRLKVGFTVDQLVHDYGDVCQAVTELAVELGKDIPTDDFRRLNKCLDFAIAQAVTEFELQRERRLVQGENARTGFMVHELRNVLTTAKLAFHVLRQGKVGIGGSTGLILERSLNALGDMLERSIGDVRLASGLAAPETVRLSELMEELQVTAAIQASLSGHTLVVASIDEDLEFETDRLVVVAAVTNLLRNAFKFSRAEGTIRLQALRNENVTLRIEVEDECGGLESGAGEELFELFIQQGTNRSGLGLGLPIARQSIRTLGGDLTVRNLPGRGCVFSVEIPIPPAALATSSA